MLFGLSMEKVQANRVAIGYSLYWVIETREDAQGRYEEGFDERKKWVVRTQKNSGTQRRDDRKLEKTVRRRHKEVGK